VVRPYSVSIDRVYDENHVAQPYASYAPAHAHCDSFSFLLYLNPYYLYRHFTIRGADGTDFEGGIYHGRILLPPEYPFKPPHIILLTPSGRFETSTKVCLSFSAYHPELWQPAWGIRLILEALISFLPTPADGAVGALDWSSVERKRLAAKSVNYLCPTCGKTADLLPKIDESKKSSNGEKSYFQKEIEQLHALQMQEHRDEKGEGDGKEAEEQKAETEAEGEGNEDRKPEAVEENAVEDTTQGDSGESSAKIEQSEIPVLAEEKQEQDVKPQAFGINGRAIAAHPALEISEAAIAAQNQRVANAVEVPDIAQAPPAAVGNGNVALHDEGSSWLVDPALQAAIAILAAICFILLRKVSALLDDLQSLD
jgi:ubiquitin-conjugating enzyme E2 J1